MIQRLLAAILLLSALLAGCEGRDHSNPFDPSNPDTGGVPPILDARAGNGSVSLVWDLGRLEGIRLLRLYRRLDGGAPVLITPGGLDSRQSSLVDTALVNGTSYAYRLELELDSDARPTSAWDQATPGTAVVWFADSEGGGLGRLSADGRDLLARSQSGLRYLDIVADSAGRGFWAAEYLEGSLEHFLQDGTQERRVAMPGARAVAVDPAGENIWVGSFSTGNLERRNRDLAIVWSDESGGPIDALISPQPGEVWVARATGKVQFYRNDEPLFEITDLRRPVAFALSGGNRLFILDHDGREVRQYDFAGMPTGSSGAIFTSPTDIETDGAGGAWVADAGRGGLVHISGQLHEIGFLAAPDVTDVTWDERDRFLWTTGNGHVRRFDPSGSLASDLSVGGRPVKVALFHEGRPR